MTEIKPVTYSVTLQVGFHPDNISCEGCPFCLDDAAHRGRKRCVITSEIIHYPRQRGIRCPLEGVTHGQP